MKNLFLTAAILVSTASFAQYDHDIQLTNGSTNTNNVTEIDSISFSDGGTPMMHLNLVNGETNEYELGLIDQVTFSGESLPVLYPPGTVHCLPGGIPTEVADVYNPDTDKTWMDRNLGASQAATAINDEAAYGDLYQWGRFSDGHQCRNSETTSTNATTAEPNQGNSWDGKFILEPSFPNDWLSSQNNNLWQGVNGINNPCPEGYRLPTDAELNDERGSWSSNNSAGAFASPLKLPAAGARFYDSGSLFSVGLSGNYWSSTAPGTSGYLYFDSSDALMFDNNRAYGFSVRCLKD